MANIQPDKYTRLPNNIYDKLCHFRIPGEIRQVFDVIARKTFGWNKKKDRISLSQFVELTEIKKPNITRALSKLITNNIVIKTDNNSYSINENYENWKPFVIKTDNAKKLSKLITNVIKTDNKTLSELIPTKEKKNTKQKTRIKNIKIPDFINREVWIAFVEMRKEIKHPVTEYAAKLLFKKLGDLRAQGNDPNEVLNQSIMHSWRGVFALKDDITEKKPRIKEIE